MNPNTKDLEKEDKKVKAGKSVGADKSAKKAGGDLKKDLNKDLYRGSMDLMVLSVLADGNNYGYLIQKRIREVTEDRVKLPAGTLYPLLHRLEDAKLIRSKWDQSSGRDRKWYELTAAGKKRLTAQADGWAEHVRSVKHLLDCVKGLKVNLDPA